jgi:hypothetical protein
MTGGYSEGESLEQDVDFRRIYQLKNKDEEKVYKIEEFIDNFKSKKNNRVKKLN